MDEEQKDNYTFKYYSHVHNRQVDVHVSLDESITNGKVIEEFSNFLSAIYGYRIELKKV